LGEILIGLNHDTSQAALLVCADSKGIDSIKCQVKAERCAPASISKVETAETVNGILHSWKSLVKVVVVIEFVVLDQALDVEVEGIDYLIKSTV
jgi:hypothetical protein